MSLSVSSSLLLIQVCFSSFFPAAKEVSAWLNPFVPWGSEVCAADPMTSSTTWHYDVFYDSLQSAVMALKEREIHNLVGMTDPSGSAFIRIYVLFCTVRPGQRSLLLKSFCLLSGYKYWHSRTKKLCLRSWDDGWNLTLSSSPLCWFIVLHFWGSLAAPNLFRTWRIQVTLPGLDPQLWPPKNPCSQLSFSYFRAWVHPGET